MVSYLERLRKDFQGGQCGYGKEIYSVERHTHIVDFSVVSSYEDPIRARSCVRVFTSMNGVGTVSHLTIYSNTSQFARDLRALIGGGVPTILNGGREDSVASVSLYTGLQEALGLCGFVLLHDPLHEDVLGQYLRDAVLMQDRVVVTRKPYDNGPLEELELFFPDPKS